MKLNFALFLAVVIVSLLLVSAAKKKVSSNGKKPTEDKDVSGNSDSKITALSKLIASSPVVSLTDKNFTKFVTDRPRDYHAILLFTATGPQYQCGVCVSSLVSYEEIAGFYNLQYDLSKTTIENKIVFFKIEVDNGRGIFNELQLETVPRLYFLPPAAVGAPKTQISKFEVDNKILLEGSRSILAEIHSITGVKVELTVNPAPLALGLSVLAVVVALFVSAAQGDLYGSVLWYQSTKIWSVVSAICFAVGVSGSIFCVIKSAPLYGMSRKGATIFATQGRDQYLLEGIIIAFMTLLSAFSAYFMVQVTKMRRFPLLRHVLVILALAVWIVMGTYIFEVYVMKTGWYHLKDTMPPALWFWISSAVKKSTTLPKRLWRVSEIWLFESKDFAGFQKKFQALVGDYVLRGMK